MTFLKHKFVSSDRDETLNSVLDRFTMFSGVIHDPQSFIDTWASIALGSSVKPARVIHRGRGIYGDVEAIGQDMYKVLGNYIAQNDLEQNSQQRFLETTNTSDWVA